MGHRGGKLAALCAAMIVALILAATAWAVTTTTTDTSYAGNVVATFTFNGRALSATHLRLRIRRAGRVVYNRRVYSKSCSPDCQPGALTSRSSSVEVVYLENHRSPNVVLELYSGGANCCFIDQVFSYAASRRTYVKTEHDFASSGALLKHVGTGWRFLSADPSFKYLFTDGADSGEPIQIWSFASGRFTDVTRDYPKRIAADAALWLRAFNHHVSNGVGFIAAWAADEELLGHDALVQSTLASEAKRGRLRNGSNHPRAGEKFIAQLNHWLRKLGYLR